MENKKYHMRDFLGEMYPKDGFVFVITYGRSGSTLLQNILNSIDGYRIRGENNLSIQPLFDSVRRIGNAHRKYMHLDEGQDTPWFGIREIDPDRYAQRLSALFVEEVLQPQKPYRVLGFKEVRYHQVRQGELVPLLRFLADTFAPAKFIFNKRSWEQVSRSGWWKQRNPESVKKTIKAIDDRFDFFYQRFPGESFMLQYEDYATSPDALVPLFEFLGEEFDRDKVEQVLARKLDH